jgi:hypothetical protein
MVCNGPETNRQPRRGRDRRELWQEVGQTQPQMAEILETLRGLGTLDIKD